MSLADSYNQVLAQTGDPFDRAVLNDSGEASLTVTPTLRTWTEAIQINGVKWATGNGDPGSAPFQFGQGFLPLEMYDATIQAQAGTATGPGNGKLIPQVGDFHNKYPDAVCTGVQIRTVGGLASSDIVVLASYAQPGKFSEVSYDVYQQTEVRNFAEDDTGYRPPGATASSNITVIPYNMPGTDTANTTGDVPFVLDVNVPSLTRSLTVTQYEIIDKDNGNGVEILGPKGISGYGRPVWNAEQFWGFDAGELLYIGRQATSDGTTLHRTQYRFLQNAYGWHHFYGVFVNAQGFKPLDIMPIDPRLVLTTDPSKTVNGAGAFRMLPSIKFATDQYISKIKAYAKYKGSLNIPIKDMTVFSTP